MHRSLRLGYWYPGARILYADIPKTASRSCLAWLESSAGKKPRIVRSLPRDVRMSFSVVRNPYDRVMSIWWSACTREDRYRWHSWGAESPMSMVRGLLERRGDNIDLGFSQAEIMDQRTLPDGHRTIRYESIEADLSDLFGEPVELPVKNRKNDMRPQVPCYCREFIELVNAWCPRDFSLGNYCMLHPGRDGT